MAKPLSQDLRERLIAAVAHLKVKHGVQAAQSTVWRLLDRHRMTFKKRRTQASNSGLTFWSDDGRGSSFSPILIPNAYSTLGDDAVKRTIQCGHRLECFAKGRNTIERYQAMLNLPSMTLVGVHHHHL